MGMSSGLNVYMKGNAAGATPVLTQDAVRAITDEVTARVNAEFPANEILAPSAEMRAKISERIIKLVQTSLRNRNLANIDPRQEQDLAQSIENQMLGLGFLERLLPPNRVDLSEIMMNQDGSVWGVMKGTSVPRRIELRPTVTEVNMVLGKILGAINRRVSEAEPVVAAKLPRSPRLPAGARVNVVAPPIANGEYPILNIRLYEPVPIKPEQLLAWGSLSREVLDFLGEQIVNHARVMIAGGTGSGKTTMLSGLANYIPKDERILLVEDPAEIFLDHPHVVSMEARPPSLEGKYSVPLGDLVTTAMRQTPKWLMVGEVRTGQAAIWLLRAQMSDHPGLSTIHADSPQAVIEMLCLLAQLDQGIAFQATRTLIARALHYVVQVGFDAFGKRRLLEIAKVSLGRDGDVHIESLLRFVQSDVPDKSVWEWVNRSRLWSSAAVVNVQSTRTAIDSTVNDTNSHSSEADRMSALNFEANSSEEDGFRLVSSSR